MRMLCSLILAAAAAAMTASAAPATRPAATSAGDDRPTVIVVVGAEGEPRYGREFAKAADQWAAAAKLGSAQLIQIGCDRAKSSDPPDRDLLKKTLESEIARPAQTLWLVLIGHGTFDGKQAKFNLRGPDLSDQDLAQWLEAAKRPLAIIDCSSCSAPFLNRLSGPNRMVVTATQSGHELQYARFGGYLAADIADPAADLDKDGQTSLLEAFLAASHQVEAFYKDSGRLATEHSLLDDNGDARGTPAGFFTGVRATRAAKDGAPVDGLRAHQLHLVPSPAERAMSPAARARRDQLELEIAALRAKKSGMPEADYYAKLEELLIKLARIYATPAETGKR